MSVKALKNYVINRRCNGKAKEAALLEKAIKAYERSLITSDWLYNYFIILQNMNA